MVRFLFAAFVATFVAAVAAIVGVPLMARTPPADTGEGSGVRAKLLAIETGGGGALTTGDVRAGRADEGDARREGQ